MCLYHSKQKLNIDAENHERRSYSKILWMIWKFMLVDVRKNERSISFLMQRHTG